MSYSSPSEIGTQHAEWLQKLDFYKQELDILKNRLTEVAGRNTHPDVMAGIEHYQNQFIVQRNNIDEYRHAVNEHTTRVKNDIQHHAGKVDTMVLTEHKRLTEGITQLEKVINELRQDFNAFLSKWM